MLHPEQLSYTPPPTEVQWTHPAVVNLNDNNFKEEFKNNDILLVMFYAPWCGHCQKMKPEYIAAAHDLQSAGFSKCLAMVDCTLNPEITEKFNIKGFPTLKLFQNGKYVKDYKGDRTVEAIKKFVIPYMNKKDEL